MTEDHDVTDTERQGLIEEHTPLVKKIARKLARKLPTNVECDDLIQDGMLGLIDAIVRASRSTIGGQFESYVAKRAHGAMVDGLRANDPGTRHIRKEMRRVEIAIQQLGHQLGRTPAEGEVATALGLPLPEYQRMLQEAHGYLLISLDDLIGGTDAHEYRYQCGVGNADPLVALERTALRKALTQAISALPEQSKVILHMYYAEDQKMWEIGEQLALSESRVSQLHTHAIAQLRAIVLGGDQPTAVLKPRGKPRQAGVSA
jgi:RNA polymerase sigma factor for flagellar operon FliA